MLIYQLGKSSGQLAGQIVGALLYMAVFGAVISYFMQCLSFIMLRRKLPNIRRPYRSPVNEWGAGIAGRHRLVLSPEEEFALTSGEHGHPETEGYGTTHVTDIQAGETVTKETTTS